MRKFQAIENAGRRKPLYLHAAMKSEDLRVPPGNRLEALVEVIELVNIAFG